MKLIRQHLMKWELLIICIKTNQWNADANKWSCTSYKRHVYYSTNVVEHSHHLHISEINHIPPAFIFVRIGCRQRSLPPFWKWSRQESRLISPIFFTASCATIRLYNRPACFCNLMNRTYPHEALTRKIVILLQTLTLVRSNSRKLKNDEGNIAFMCYFFEAKQSQ